MRNLFERIRVALELVKQRRALPALGNVLRQSLAQTIRQFAIVIRGKLLLDFVALHVKHIQISI